MYILHWYYINLIIIKHFKLNKWVYKLLKSDIFKYHPRLRKTVNRKLDRNLAEMYNIGVGVNIIKLFFD